MPAAVADLVTKLREALAQESQEARSLAARLRALDFAEPGSPARIREVEGNLEAHARELLAIGASLERLAAGAAGLTAVLKAWEGARAAAHPARTAMAQSLEALAAALEAEQGARALDRVRLAEGLRSLAEESGKASRLAARVTELDRDAANAQAEIRAREGELAALGAQMRARDAELGRLQSEIHARDGRISAQSAEAKRLQGELAAAAQRIHAQEAALGQERAEVSRLQAILAEDAHRLVTRVGAMFARHPALAAIVRAPVRWLRRLLDRP